MTLILLILYAALVFYAAAACILSFALISAKFPVSDKHPYISVVVAARNESETIERCINAIAAQDYPAEKFEIIVADDRSTDYTGEILENLRIRIKNLKVIHIKIVPSGIAPKKNAIKEAIGVSSGEIIAQTDADCMVPETWLSALTAHFTENVGMVTGIAPYFKKPGFLNSFIRHEYLWNAFLMTSSAALGHPSHSCARNLAFRRDVFESADGYGERSGVISGDDTLLMHSIQKKTGTLIVPAISRLSPVYTDSPPTFGLFLRQRIRHMSTGRFFNPAQIISGGVVYGFHFFLLIIIPVSFFFRETTFTVISVFLCKILIDIFIAAIVRKKLSLPVEWHSFVLNEIFLLAYMALLPFLGMFIPVRWKEIGINTYLSLSK